MAHGTTLAKRLWLGINFVLASCAAPSISMPPAQSPVAPVQSEAEIRYTVRSLPKSDLHVVEIPAGSSYMVTPAVAPQTALLESFAQQYGAVAVLNGGFFDPQNQLSTSYVVIDAELIADPTQNDRLINNPDLTNYLEQILNRTEFRRYQCGQAIKYDIALHREMVPDGCELLDALGAGPRLLPALTSTQEGFTDTDANGTVIRDAIGSSQPNARTGIGITANGNLVWVMAAQKPGISQSGVSLPELAAILQDLDAVEAMNLDGGSSSSLFYRGETIYGKLDGQDQPVIRPVKSVLLLRPN